jgi:hypothetical protein
MFLSTVNLENNLQYSGKRFCVFVDMTRYIFDKKKVELYVFHISANFSLSFIPYYLYHCGEVL